MARGKARVFSREPGSRVRDARKRQAERGFAAGALPVSPPAELKDAPEGRRAWRQLMKAQAALPDDIFNALDRAFLVNYCLAIQSLSDARDLEREIRLQHSAGEVELQDLLKCKTEVRMTAKLVHDLEKAMYANPKSRAGVNPPPREPEEQDDLEDLLNEFVEHAVGKGK